MSDESYMLPPLVYNSTNRIQFTTKLSGAIAGGISWAKATVEISKDGGSFAATSGTPTEIGSTGVHYLSLSNSETTCQFLTVRVAAVGGSHDDITLHGITVQGVSSAAWFDAINANPTYIKGTAIATTASGYFPADARRIDGSAFGTHATGYVPSDLRRADGSTTTTFRGLIADSVWDEATSGHSTAGTTGKALTDILEDTGSSLASLISGIESSLEARFDDVDAAVATVDSVVDAILVDTDTTIPGLISGLSIPTAAAIADAVWDEAAASHVSAGSFGEQIRDMPANVWGETLSTKTTSDTTGNSLRILDAIDIETRFDTVDTNDGIIANGVTLVNLDTIAILEDTGTTIPNLLSNIAVTGSAVNTVAGSYTLTTGTQDSGTFADTAAADGTYHVHSDSSGQLDLYYEFDVGGDGIPTGAQVVGNLTNANDDLEIYAYDWVGAAWQRVGTWEGTNGAVDDTINLTLLTNHVGTGSDIGKVRIRFTDGAFTLTSAVLSVDQIVVSYSIANRSVGYALGAIWIDTTNGTAGTEPFVNGTADNPVDSYADALTLAAALNLGRFFVLADSPITLSATTDDKTFLADNLWVLALGGQDIESSSFRYANVSGTASSSGDVPTFDRCQLQTVTLPPCRIYDSGIAVGITAQAAGDFILANSRSNVAGTGTPYYDCNGFACNWDLRNYSGGAEFRNLASGDAVSLEGNGQLVIAASCTGGTIALRGNFAVTDNSGGAVTIVRTWDSLVDLIWDEPLSGHATAGTAGATLADVLVDTGTTIPATLSTLATQASVDVIDGIVDAILVDTDTTIPGLISGLSIPTAAAIADAVWDEATAGHVTAGTFGLLAADVLTDTGTTIPGLIAALNNLSAAEVNAEVDTALADIGLDHLLSAAVTGTDVTDDSVIAQLVSKSATADWDSFDNTTDSLEALADSTPTVDTAAIADAVWDEALAGHATAGSAGAALSDVLTDTGTTLPATLATLATQASVDTIDGIVDSILEDTGTTIPATLSTLATAASIAALNDLSAAQVNAEVDTALADIGLDHLLAAAVTGTDVTDNSIIARLVSASATADWDTFDNTTDSLEALAAGGGLTAAAIADAVWTEAIADHSGTAGSTAEALADVLVDTGTTLPATLATLATASALATVDANVDLILEDTGTTLPATLSTLATQASVDVIDGIVDAILVDTDTTIPGLIAALNDPTAAAIADAVWEELIADHSGTSGSVAEALDNVSAGASPSVIAAAVWDELVAGHVTAGTFGLYVQDILTDTAAIPTAGAIADAVWDEPTAGHVTAGTFGDAIGDLASEVAALPTASETADAVWDEPKAGHVTAGTFGEEVQSHALSSELFDPTSDGVFLTTAGVNAVADQVWEEQISDHSGTSGSVAEALDAAGTVNAAAIADAIWDEPTSGHTTAGTFGKLAADVLEDTDTTIPGLISAQTSTIQADIAALENLSAAEAADAVWDEAKAGHVTAGSFGEEVQSHALSSEVSALNDLSIADVQTALTNQGYTSGRAPNLDNLDATVSSRSTFDVSSDVVIVDPDAVADAVWNEDIATHSVAGTFGEFVQDQLDVAVSTRASAAAVAALNDLSSADVQAALTAQGYTVARAGNLDNLDAAVSTRSDFDETTDDVTIAAASRGTLVDEIWDEPIAGHLTAGTTGASLDGATAPSASDVADAVWDEATAGHATAGTFGALLGTNVDATISSRSTFDPTTDEVDVGEVKGVAVTGVDDFKADVSSLATAASIAALNDLSSTDVANAVWNASQASYTAAGSTGESLDQASAGFGLTAAAIADAVWDEVRSGHTTAGTFGETLDATVSSRASQTSLDALNDLSSADVQAALDSQGYTAARSGNLDNLDVAVSTRSDFDETTDPVDLTAGAVDDIWDEPIAGHLTAGTVGRELSDKADSTEISALENLSAADVQSALTAQGYTSARAALLDNLDAAVSSRSTFDNTTDTVLLAVAAQAAVADAVWDEDVSGHSTSGSFGERLETTRKHVANRAVITGSGPYTVTIYEDDGTTPLKTFTVSADKRDRSP